jgi:predicted component of type VI protein secretion system
MQKMANNLFNALNGQQTNPMSQLVTEARRLKQTMQNPRAEVERLLQTGQMSQQDFNKYSQIAQQIVGSGAFR